MMIDFQWVFQNLPENRFFWLVVLVVLGLLLLVVFLEIRTLRRRRRRWGALVSALSDLDGVPYKSFGRRRSETIFLGTNTDMARATGRLILDD